MAQESSFDDLRDPLQFQLSLLRLAVMAHTSTREAAAEPEHQLEDLAVMVTVPRSERR